jgi:hypothetical protein
LFAIVYQLDKVVYDLWIIITAVVFAIRSRCTARSFSKTPLQRVSVALNAAAFKLTQELVAPNQLEYSPLQD